MLGGRAVAEGQGLLARGRLVGSARTEARPVSSLDFAGRLPHVHLQGPPARFLVA